MLAILKSGAAYLPVDAAYPEERLAFMLRDAGVKRLLAAAGVDELLFALAAAAGDDQNAVMAVASALARAAERANFAAIMAYLARLSPEFQTLGIVSATKRDATLCETAAYTQWAVSNPGVVR